MPSLVCLLRFRFSGRGRSLRTWGRGTLGRIGVGQDREGVGPTGNWQGTEVAPMVGQEPELTTMSVTYMSQVVGIALQACVALAAFYLRTT